MSDTAAPAPDATSDTADASTTSGDASTSSAASGPMGLTKKQEIGIAIGVVAVAVLLFCFVYWKKKLCFKPKKSLWDSDAEKGRAGTTTNQRTVEKDEMDESEAESEEESDEESEEEKPAKRTTTTTKDDKRLSRPAARRSDRAAKTLSTIKEKAEDDKPTRSKKAALDHDGAAGKKARPKSTVQKTRVVNESEEDSELEVDEDVAPEPKRKSKRH